MPRVVFMPQGVSVEVSSGTTLFDAARSKGIPVASSCQADFVCGKCHMKVLEGAENLSPQSDAERRLLSKEKAPLSNRMSCQVEVLGDCTVTTSYW